MSVDIPSLSILAQANGLSLDELIKNIETAIDERYSELQEAEPGVHSRLDRESGSISLYKNIDGEELSVDGPPEFPRIATGVIRKTLKGKLREVKDAEIVQEFSTTIGDLVSGVVQQGRDSKVILVNIGPVEGKIPLQEQVPTEKFVHGDRIKALIVDVRQGNKGPEIVLSRTHPNLIKKLFALEVPELVTGVVEIMGVAREAGARTKMAVRAHRAGVNPKGSCIGPMGARVQAVMNELHGEKIDIVDWSEEPTAFIAAALAPSRVVSCEVVDPERKQAKVVVPDFQLSLAIGKDGQNARLAARLTGWRIDIHPDEVG
jgi:transcription termination/antitermination protein NusA